MLPKLPRDKYNKVRADIMNKYDLTRQRNNIENNNMLEIKGKFSHKVIIYHQ